MLFVGRLSGRPGQEVCTMRGSLMDPDPTARDRRTPVETVEMTCSTPVRVALEVLEARREATAVVFDDGRPVGVVTLDALTRPGLAGHEADVRVASVMDFELVRISAGAGELETLQAYRDAAWLSLRHRHPCAFGE
jgi:predicted transcriptional regulator